MSLSGSSASRNSIWAMTRLASSSSMNVGRKMIRSLSSREKMSNARSPRGVCSMTIGTKAMPTLLREWCLRGDARVFDEQVEGLALAEPVTQGVQVAALLHHTPDGRGRPLAGRGELLALALAPGGGGRDPPWFGDRAQRQRPPHRFLGARPQLSHDLAVVPLDAVGIDTLAAQPLAGVLDLVGDLPHDHGVGHAELVAGQQRIDDLVLELAPRLRLPLRLQLAAHLGPDRVERVELAERLGELVVEGRQQLLLDLTDLQRGGAGLAPQRLHPVIVGEAEADLTLVARPHADDGGIDLRQHGAAADDEVIAGGGGRLVALGGERVVDDDQVALGGGALDAAELGVLVAHALERLHHFGIRDRRGRVLDLHAAILGQDDGRLDFDDGREGQRRAFLQREVPKVRLVHGVDARLGQRAAVDVRDEVLGHLSAHIVREVQLHERARHVPAPEARQARPLLHAPVGLLPLLLDDVRRRLDSQTTLASLDLLHGDLHAGLVSSCGSYTRTRCSQVVREGGVEPPRAASPPDPKSGASASFATLAEVRPATTQHTQDARASQDSGRPRSPRPCVHTIAWEEEPEQAQGDPPFPRDGGLRVRPEDSGDLGGRGGRRDRWRRRPPALEESLVLGPEAYQAPFTDAIGEPDVPPLPRYDATQPRIPAVALMPRASADQHSTPCVARHVPHHLRRRHGDLARATPREAPNFHARVWKSVPGSERALRGHNGL